jgi:hypothetical protein
VTQLKQDINVICILKEVLELHHVLMLDGAMNLDLGHELLLCTTFGEGGLKNNFSGSDCTSLLTSKLVALSETTLAQELSLDVAAHLGLSRGLHYSFLHDRRH